MGFLLTSPEGSPNLSLHGRLLPYVLELMLPFRTVDVRLLLVCFSLGDGLGR